MNCQRSTNSLRKHYHNCPLKAGRKVIHGATEVSSLISVGIIRYEGGIELTTRGKENTVTIIGMRARGINFDSN